jgi:gamma-glutamylputrescine oxidase
MSAHVASWYASSTTAPTRPELAGDLDADVCIVGGGIAGCSTALHLAERGYRVVLLEAELIGWGASGRSGAQAITGVACGQSKLESLVGAGDARRIWDMTVEALALQRELIDRHQIDCDFVAGQMHVALKPRQENELREDVETAHARYGYDSLRMVERAEVQSLIASDRYIAGTYDSTCGHLHPLKYTLGLAAAAERAGAKIFERSRALGYERTASGSPTAERSSSPLIVRTARGLVRCRSIALCGNAWLGPLAPALARKIVGVGTYIVATEPLGAERAAALITNNAAVTDINWVIDYFRRSSDHRLLFGGRVSYSGLDPLGTRRATRARMLKVFPQLADTKIDCTSFRGSADMVSPSPASPANCWPRRSGVVTNDSMSSLASSIGISRAARLYAAPRWCSRCSGTDCAICFSSAAGGLRHQAREERSQPFLRDFRDG